MKQLLIIGLIVLVGSLGLDLVVSRCQNDMSKNYKSLTKELVGCKDYNCTVLAVDNFKKKRTDFCKKLL